VKGNVDLSGDGVKEWVKTLVRGKVVGCSYDGQE
jgi:hypothetical protein